MLQGEEDVVHHDLHPCALRVRGVHRNHGVLEEAVAQQGADEVVVHGRWQQALPEP